MERSLEELQLDVSNVRPVRMSRVGVQLNTSCPKIDRRITKRQVTFFMGDLLSYLIVLEFCNDSFQFLLNLGKFRIYVGRGRFSPFLDVFEIQL